jgi:hypothetical protein
MSKKNIKKILNNTEGDEPCMCGHPRRSHLGIEGLLCFGCYSKKESWFHPFKLDNLMYIEKLYDRRQLDKFKKDLEKFKRES